MADRGRRREFRGPLAQIARSPSADSEYFDMSSAPVTVCALFYGPHPDLCRRFLTSLYRFTPVGSFTLRVGLNSACAETAELVEAASRQHQNIYVQAESKNIFKSPLMAKLFALRPIETDWVIWFDDDSYPYRNDWLTGLGLKIESQPAVDVWGDIFHIVGDKEAVRFVQTAAWFRGNPFRQERPLGERNERPVFTFATGGFWAAKTTVLQALRWPDARLIHRGEDFFFGEALRQNGFTIGQYKSGVRINQAERRCPRDIPSSYGQPAQLAAEV